MKTRTRKELEMAGLLWLQMELTQLKDKVKGKIEGLSPEEEKIVQETVETQVYYAKRQTQRQLEKKAV